MQGVGNKLKKAGLEGPAAIDQLSCLLAWRLELEELVP